MIKNYNFFNLLDRFIYDCENSKFLKKNGTRFQNGTLQNYKSMRSLLLKFCIECKTDLRINNLLRCTEKEFNKEKIYWKRVYKKLTNFMYKDCNHYDNYVGANMKYLRSFFNYLYSDRGIDTRSISKLFYVVKEEIPIIVLSVEQLNFLIFDKSFSKDLPYRLEKIKDIFVFGCTVGLRVSDLLKLSKINMEQVYNTFYIKLFSKKTSTFTRIKLPDYAVSIIKKYEGKYNTLLPKIHLYNLNKYSRELAERAGWVHNVEKTRKKKGIIKIIKPHSIKHFRFCDLISSHTMRRTAITLYLSLGMPEQLVRRISGHTSTSKEFFRYVKYSEELFDKEIDKVHSKFTKKS